MPRGARSYMGLGVCSRCITVACTVMTCFFMQSFIGAPLPIRSYVWAGMCSRSFIVMNNDPLADVWGSNASEPEGFLGCHTHAVQDLQGALGA